jgi:hypothetical protein
MDNCVENENLKLYRRLLSENTDEEQRKVLLVLLRLLVQEQDLFSPHALGSARATSLSP